MFREFKENFFNIITSRLIVLLLIFIAVGAGLIYRIFDLQIVNGAAYLENFTLKIKKEKTIESSRGNIYDRDGQLLAYNELAYSVTIEDVYESGSTKNATINQTVYKLIKMIEENGDKLINDFNIVLDSDDQYAFAVEDKQLLRFLADIYGHTSTDDLTYAQSSATPDEVIEYLCGTTKYGIGEYSEETGEKIFHPGFGYTKNEILQILTIRFGMSANSFQKFIATTVATDVSEKTVAVVMENSDILEGVSIAEDTVRKYVDSVYFSHIIGYTGRISQDELDTLSIEDDSYTLNDVIGKSGIEKVMEAELSGTKGSETVYVDNLGKAIETTDRIEPIAGNDLHLTIDLDLQKATYNILEQKIAGILVSRIQNIKEYIPTENATAASIKIPINDVYFALINNNVIDISRFKETYASETEQEVHTNFIVKQTEILNELELELTDKQTVYSELSKEYHVYESYILTLIGSKNRNILPDNNIDKEDEVYLAWINQTISLKEYLVHAIAMNWVDITKIELEDQYSDSEEIYAQLLNYILTNLEDNTDFSKKIYKYMIQENSLTGMQVCLVLWEQDIIDIDSKEIEELKSGVQNSYNFMLKRIENLDITPAQLALDPCSGSCVITDVTSGDVLALVTYPSYDNNKLANSVDAEYYAQLNADLSIPLWDYATQQTTAPGSTFKMISAVAALEEGVIDTNDTVTCLGVFDKLDTDVKCWINPGRHGSLNVSGAIQNSCNFFFYEMGYRLGSSSGSYNSEEGLEKLAYYADLFGLSDKSGVEITEESPSISNMDAVRSAIGQGTNSYTTTQLAKYVTAVANSGTCYNLSLLGYLTDSKGTLLVNYKPSVRNQISIDQSTWDAVHLGMRKVIEAKAYYADLGINVAGKTGTAQMSSTRPNHALFVGYAPYENPEIAIATRIAFGYTSDYAAEVSRDVISYYYGLAADDELLTGTAEIPEAQGNGGD